MRGSRRSPRPMALQGCRTIVRFRRSLRMNFSGLDAMAASYR